MVMAGSELSRGAVYSRTGVIVRHDMDLSLAQALSDTLDTVSPRLQLIPGVEVVETVATARQILAIPSPRVATVEADHRKGWVSEHHDWWDGTRPDLRLIHGAIRQSRILKRRTCLVRVRRFQPGTMPKLHRNRVMRQHLAYGGEIVKPVRIVRIPGRKLEQQRAELASVAHWLDHLAESREGVGGRGDHVTRVVAVVPRQLAVCLHIENEVIRGALRPNLEVVCRLQMIERRIHFNEREEPRVVADTLRFQAGLIVFRRIKRVVVRPARRADANRRRCHWLLLSTIACWNIPSVRTSCAASPVASVSGEACTATILLESHESGWYNEITSEYAPRGDGRRTRWETRTAALLATPVATEQRLRVIVRVGGHERVGCAMTADITCDRQAAIKERRTAYEAEVTDALLDESAAEREERFELVRMAQAMILRAFHVEDEPVEN